MGYVVVSDTRTELGLGFFLHGERSSSLPKRMSPTMPTSCLHVVLAFALGTVGSVVPSSLWVVVWAGIVVAGIRAS